MRQTAKLLDVSWCHVVRVALIVAAGIATSACWSSWFGANYRIGVGVSKEIPDHLGDCDEDVRPADVAEVQNGFIRGLEEGRAKMHCEESRVVWEVVEIDRLAIEVSESVDLAAVPVGDRVYFTLRAYDADGERVDLGDSTTIDWRYPPGMHEGHHCNHMLGTCSAPWQSKAHVDAPGVHRIEVAVAGETAVVELVGVK